MFVLTVVLLAGVGAAQLSNKPYYDLNDADDLFQEFLQKHGKTYNPEEHLTRLDIFKENLKEINERNARHPHTEFGVTRFTDLTSEERRQYLGIKTIDDSIEGLAKIVEYPAEAITAPDQFDWRDHDVVTTVKDQGHCGARWLFTATGVIESQYAMKYKQLVSLSVQQILDCIFVRTSQTSLISLCSEGWPHDVFNYYQFYYGAISGVASEDEYPYTGRLNNPHGCRMYQRNHSLATITNVTGYEIYTFKDEESLKQLLYETGPLAVGLDSSEIYEYTKGVYHPRYCTDPIDGSMLLVGYGEEDGVKYWTLKNSWGRYWGEDGYFRLVRGKEACHMGIWYATACTVE